MKNLRDIISRELLPRVRQPGQYIGLEVNALLAGRLDAAGQAALRAGEDIDPRGLVTVAMAFPDTYGVGISHLGSQVLYQLLNTTPGAAADRTYCPQADAQAVMREHGIELFGWESRCRLRDFDIIGFSMGYEMCVTNVLTMLDLAGLPLHSADRDETHPLIIAGDAFADSPEPMADFIDIFISGDGEVPLAQLVELVRCARSEHWRRRDLLLEAARTIAGAYVPSLYEPAYNADGTLKSLSPVRPDVPAAVQRVSMKQLDQSPAIVAPLVPLAEGIHERVVIEIMRGCPNACRFCQAGHTRLPVRWRSVDEIMDLARKGIAATGFDEIALLSLSTSDYPKLDELIDRLGAEFTPRHVSISLPSLRVDSQLKQLPRLTSGVRKGGLTIAAEAGSERLRRAIGKDITEADMLAGVRAAYQAGWKSVKVYFMAGLPGETEQDIDAIYDLCVRLSDERRAVDKQRGSISASVSWFVPKPHTPLQWSPMRDAEYFFSVRRQLKDLSYRTPISFKFHRIERSLLEAVLCRGDRRLGAAIEAAWRAGANMDSWDEHFDYTRWQQAIARAGLDEAFYRRAIPVEEALPWSHIQTFRSCQYMKDQFGRAMQELAPLPPE